MPGSGELSDPVSAGQSLKPHPEPGRVLGSEWASSPRHKWAGVPWGRCGKKHFQKLPRRVGCGNRLYLYEVTSLRRQSPLPLKPVLGEGQLGVQQSQKQGQRPELPSVSAGCGSEFRPGKPASPRLEPTGPVAGVEPGSGAERERE